MDCGWSLILNIQQAKWGVIVDTVKDRRNGNGRKCYLSNELHMTVGVIDLRISTQINSIVHIFVLFNYVNLKYNKCAAHFCFILNLVFN